MGLQQSEADVPQLKGTVAVLLWLTAVLLQCKADIVTSSVFSKEARKHNF